MCGDSLYNVLVEFVDTSTIALKILVMYLVVYYTFKATKYILNGIIKI